MGNQKVLPERQVHLLNENVERDPRRVRRDNRVRTTDRSNLAVDVVLDINALGYGLDENA